MASWRTWLWRLAGAALLTIVFLAYLRPDFMLDLANRFWMCM
ncbi:hypothetical protein SAMN05880566_12021 [Janthinobacterium sp. TND4EL3]|nr:hypothetical protein [Janthinobacterium sp. TND4EL3]SIR75143.1 hypothetical protein SAMN05880566_12021 [Janthinobacterium sp. TND4EL3]